MELEELRQKIWKLRDKCMNAAYTTDQVAMSLLSILEELINRLIELTKKDKRR